MNTPTDAPEVARSYREFLDSFQANDDKAVRQSYRELLRLGRPRAEILDEAVRLFGTNNAGLDTFGDRLAKSNPVEPLGSADRIARLRTSTKISNGAERTFGVNAATLSIAAPNSCNGQTTPEPTVEFNLQRVQPSNQVHSAENVAREMAIYPYGHR